MRSSFAHVKGLSGFHGSEIESVLTLEPYRSLEEPGWGWERGSKLLKDLNASSSNEKRWYPFPKPVEDLGRDPYQLGTAPGICCGFRGCRDFAAWDVGPRQGSLPQGRIRPTHHRSNKPGIKYARLGVACLSVQSGQLKLPSLQATPSTQQACRFLGDSATLETLRRAGYASGDLFHCECRDTCARQLPSVCSHLFERCRFLW